MEHLRAFFSNLRAPMPLPAKIWLVFRNNGYKLLHRQNCCGHPGEPGC